HWLGAGLVRAGQTDEGLERLREAVRSAEGAARADPTSPFASNRVAEINADLGFALADLRRRPEEMCAALGRTVAIWGSMDGDGRLPGEDRSGFDRARTLLQGCPKS